MRQKLAVNFVAHALRRHVNVVQAEQLGGLKAMLAGDKDGPLPCWADRRWSVKTDSFNRIGKFIGPYLLRVVGGGRALGYIVAYAKVLDDGGLHNTNLLLLREVVT